MKHLFPILKALVFISIISIPLLGRESVVIAAEDDWAPYSSAIEGQDEPVGLSPKLVKAAFDTQDIDVVFLITPFARCLHYAEIGRTIGCFNATITEGNKNTYHWHPTPLFYEELGIFARTDIKDNNLTQDDLDGETISLTTGYTYPTSLTEDERITKFFVNSDAYQLKMLASGRVKYALLNTMPAYERISNDPELQGKVHRVGRISQDGFWVPFTKQDPRGQKMAEIFERGLQEIHKNGTYDALIREFRNSLGLTD